MQKRKKKQKFQIPKIFFKFQFVANNLISRLKSIQVRWSTFNIEESISMGE